MADLIDYSGEFKPDLDLREFSKDALVRLWMAGGKLYIGLEALWYDAVKKLYGEEVAQQISEQIWLRNGGSEQEVRRIKEAMNILGDDVASYLKMLQVDPGFAAIMETKCELVDAKRGVATVTKCRVLRAMERAGDQARIIHCCHVLEPTGFQLGAHTINPKIKATPLKLPPRQSPEEIACQWEFVLED